MERLAQFDVSRRFTRPQFQLAAKIVFGAACGAAMIGLRFLFDMWAPTSGPFALVYPTVLLATLYGHWQAGAVAYLVSFFWAWYIVLPTPGAFHFEVPTDPSRVALNAFSVLVVLIFAETFRAAAERARVDREREIERRTLLLDEIEHRTKNNFALVASLLEIQKRRETAEDVKQAFDDAIGRVRTFADAYSHLDAEHGEGAPVDMRPYLEQLIERIGNAAFRTDVAIETSIADIQLPRETAVAIGLFANEALTNCAKYAFPDGRKGHVRVDLARQGESWRLAIRDNGIGGNGREGTDSGGLGSSLLAAFARQARATHSAEFDDSGCKIVLAEN